MLGDKSMLTRFIGSNVCM